jgi:hypothetical protein
MSSSWLKPTDVNASTMRGSNICGLICKRNPLRCMWCRGGYFHKDCLEKAKENSTVRWRNSTLTEEEKSHLPNYCGCSQAKEKSFRRSAERAPSTKTPIRRAFSFRYSTPTHPFAVAVRRYSHQGITRRQQ